QDCFVCRRSGATTTCWEVGCERSFHLPCATARGCVTQYFPPYRDSLPEQLVEAAQEGTTSCIICLEEFDDTKTYGTLVRLACKHAWFHRVCIQGQALRDGFTQLRCLLCQDADGFQGKMLRIGVHVPFR
ncbi:G2/M phase-specific E3 ubiquitin-protein ligase, partial [Merops nubicus]